MSKYFIIQDDTNKQEKIKNWDISIGLQEVDNLKPSEYLIEVAKANIEGNLTYQEIEELLYKKYEGYVDEPTNRQKECDIVASRMAAYLSNHSFRFSPIELSLIHKYLFHGIIKDKYGTDVAGEYRPYNIKKEEPILNGMSVTYGDFRTIKEYLDYDFSEQRDYDFSEDPTQIIKRVAKFTSNIWQIHPFREGNTRTIALFMQCYLQSLGFEINNEIFAEKSMYFRNALVRANYANYANGIREDMTGLEAFYENLLFGGTHELRNRNLFVTQLFNKEELKDIREDIEEEELEENGPTL